jgi:AraC-like DNA-binding protein
MEELCQHLPSLVPVTYARLTPDLVAHLRRLARIEFSDVILADYDDSPSRFVELADRAHSASLTGRVLHCLEPALAVAPAQVRLAVRDLFYSPKRYRSVDDLAAAANMPRRSLYRSVERLGLSSPRLFITASRVVRATGLLRDPNRTLREVARQLGYSKSDHLGGHISLFTGLRVRDLRQASLEILAATIVAKLRLEDTNAHIPAVAQRLAIGPLVG